jgi:hypothetical protein
MCTVALFHLLDCPIGRQNAVGSEGPTNGEEGILEVEAGEDSGICWDEVEEGYGLGTTGWRVPVAWLTIFKCWIGQ